MHADDGDFDANVDMWRVRVYGVCNSFQEEIAELMNANDDEDD